MRRAVEAVDITTGIRENLDPKKFSKRSKTEAKKKELVNALLHGRGTFPWFSGEQILDKSLVELLIEFSFGTEKDITFLIQCIYLAKKKKVASEIIAIAVAVLSASPHKIVNEKFDKIFSDTITDIELLIKFVEIIKSTVFRGFGRRVRKSLAKWILNINEFDAISYTTLLRVSRSHLNRRINTFTIKDVTRLCHPKPRNEYQQMILEYLIRGRVHPQTPKIILAWIELLSLNLTSQNKRFIELIENNNFPLDALIKRFGGAKILWSTIFNKTDFFTLLINLNNFSMNGVFEDPKNVTRLVSILTNKDTIKNSGLTPFHFLKAHDTFVGKNSLIFNALRFALEVSYQNLPMIKKSIGIIADVSIQTKGSQISSDYKTSTAMTIASVAAIFHRISKDCSVIPVSSSSLIVGIDHGLDTIEASERVVGSSRGSGRDFRNSFQLMNAQKKKYDILLAITSQPSWRNVLTEYAIGSELNKYINEINPQLKLLLWQLEETNVYHGNHDLKQATLVDSFTASSIKFIIDQLTEIDYLAEAELIEI